MPQDQGHWLPSFNLNLEEWDAEGQTYETLVICRSLELAPRRIRGCDRGEARRRFMIRSRTWVVQRHPQGDR